MIDRDDKQKRVQKAVRKLVERGTRPENIASTIGVSYATVKNWMAGRRVPKNPTIGHLEHVYGIKIL